MIRFGSWIVVFTLALGVLSCDAIDTGTLSDQDIGDAIDVGGTITELLGDTATDLGNDPDPAVQAAGESAAAAEREKEKSDDPLDPSKIVDVLETLPLGPDPDAKPGDDPLAPEKIINVLETLPLGNTPPEPAQSSADIDADAFREALKPRSPEEARARVEADPRSYHERLGEAVAEVASGESPEGAKAAALYLISKYNVETVDIGTEYPPQLRYLYTYNMALELGLKGTRPGEAAYDRLTAELCAQRELWETTYPVLPLPWETGAVCQ